MQLNAWTRLAIVVTGLWLLGGSIYFSVRMQSDWSNTVSITRDICVRLAERGPRDQYAARYGTCWDEWEAKIINDAPPFRHALYAAMGIAVVAWIVGLIGLTLVRWILAGRKKVR